MRSELPEPSRGSDGLDDTHLGVTYRLVNEYDHPDVWAPTVSFRSGIIIPGGYRSGTLESTGDGAFGAEWSLQAGKHYDNIGAGFHSHVGYRLREGSVPEDFFAGGGVYKTLFEDFTTHIDFRHISGTSGPDIGGTNFDMTRFFEVRERREVLDVGFGYTDCNGFYYGVIGSTVLAGRNTQDNRTVAALFTMPFDL